MKFSHTTPLCLLLSLFAACSPALIDKDGERISFSITQFIDPEEGIMTRTSIASGNEFIWAAGDTVGIYPNTGSQVYFAMTSGVGAKTAEFDGGGWDFKPSAVYYSYYPFIGDIYLNRNHIPVRYTGQKQIGTTGIEHIGPYDYMYTPATSAADGKLNFSYKHLSCIIRPKVTLPAGKWEKLAITAPSAVFATQGYFDLAASEPAIVPTAYSNQIQIDLEGISLSGETSFYIYILSAPVDLKGKEITVSVLNDKRTEFQCKKTPSYVYTAGFIGGLTCNSWTEVPQSMGLILQDWEDGGSIGGSAD